MSSVWKAHREWLRSGPVEQSEPVRLAMTRSYAAAAGASPTVQARPSCRGIFRVIEASPSGRRIEVECDVCGELLGVRVAR